MTKIANYEQIDVMNLSDEIQDELCNSCPGNDAGRIVNPIYHPLFKAWLIANNKEVKPYLCWWSW